MKKSAKWYIESLLKIKTKDSRIKKFKLNSAQKRLYDVIKKLKKEKKPVRIIILKARQMGFSTFTEALIFYDTVTHENVTSGIVAHTTDSATNLFKMSKLFYDELPSEMKPMLKGSNAKELIFENPAKRKNEKLSSPGLRSKIKCSTASGNGIGRGDTLTNVHVSEYAFWEGDKRSTLTGLLQAVPNLPESMVIIESTANGFDDFKAMWDSAVNKESDFVPLFFPWFEMKEYRMKFEGGPLSDEEKDLKTRFNLDDEQIAWRRWCIKNNCGNDMNKFRQEYPATPEEAFIMSGESVFDKEKLISQLSLAEPNSKRGRFIYDYNGLSISNIRWTDCENGEIKIYEEPMPNRPYVIGGDTSGEGSDYFTAHVLDNTTGKQVAVMKHRYDDDLYAKQIYCLGMYYNRALIAIESNFTTYPIRELQRLKYPHQYTRESVDVYTGGIKESYGFNTNSKTRPLLIAELIKVYRDSPELIIDKDTLREMLVFIYDENRKPCAMRGEHDDLVMALGIAHFVRPKQSYTEKSIRPKMNNWTDDMKEDYKNASAEGRKYLLKKWNG